MALVSLWAYGVQAAETAAVSQGIEEVVVTANRRSESTQNVPNTIQAFSATALSQLNISSLDSLLKYLPNVTFASNGPGSGNIFMRGLSAGFAGNQSSATIAAFPNVALYLDDQSMTFPARNVDVYTVDLERVEVLEGPQGTLFGGGAEAGAVRYITNKPKLDKTEGNFEASTGITEHGDPNYAFTAMFNLPIIDNKFAMRAVVYNDRRGGYIDNVPSTFTRKPTDLGPASYGTVYPTNLQVYNNYAIAKKAQNPTTYTGVRVSAAYEINNDWDVLVQQSFQNLDADGANAQYPTGSDGQALRPWETTTFSPIYDKDKFSNTAWTINGKIRDLKLIYTGAYLSRHIDQTNDYTNYARTAGGFYYSCVGGPASGSNIGAGTPGVCYSAVSGWHDIVDSTHQSHEFRLSTPDDWRLRALIGVFYEDFEIKDNMNFEYKTIPSCTPAALAAFKAGGPLCVGNTAPAPGSYASDPSARDDNNGFGEDVRRGYTQTAFFGSVDYDIIPKVLTVTAGTRHYSYDEFEEGSQWGTSTSCVGIPNGTCYGTPLTAASHAAKYSGFRSRANATWHITSDIMVYYTYSEGFRPGAGNRLNNAVSKIDVDTTTGKAKVGVDNSPHLTFQFQKPFTYAPDSLINNEIGFKTEILDHRLQLNGSLYDMQWQNVQTGIYNPPVFGNTTFGTNGPDYEIKGFELQTVAKPTEQLTVQGSLSYNQARETNSPCVISTYVAASGKTQNPTPLGSCITQVWSSPQHQNVPIVNPLGAVGAVPAFSPTVQFNARARYDWTIKSYFAHVMAGASYTGSMYNQPSSFPSGDGVLIPTTTQLRYTQPGYTTVDASFGIAKDNWYANIFGSNLTNKNASTFTSTGQFIKAETPLRPRVLGIKFGSSF